MLSAVVITLLAGVAVALWQWHRKTSLASSLEQPDTRSPIMYNPVEQRETDLARLLDYVRDNPFATLISHSPQRGLSATRLAFLLRPAATGWSLVGHMSKANPQWQDWHQNTDDSVLVVFARDQHAYISPRFYPSQTDVVPTWDYTAVQVRGRVRTVTDVDAKLALMAELVDSNEAAVRAAGSDCPFAAQPWNLMDACTPGYVGGQLQRIVVFTVAVEQIQGRFKLSQNRSADDVAHISHCLHAAGSSLRLSADGDRVT